MTSRITISIFLSFILSCSQKEERFVVETFSSGKPKKENVYDNDDPNIYKEILYFENGNIKSEIDYKNTRFNGKILEFNENGTKKFDGTAEMDSFIGVKLNFDEKGKLRQIDSLSNKWALDECCGDGTITRFFANGKIKERFTEKSGTVNGEAISFYESGQIKSKKYFLDDKENGSSSYWYKNGKLKMEKTYQNGVADGPTIEYYDSYKVQGQFINGTEEGQWKYLDTLDRITKIVRYKNGKASSK